MKNKSEEKEVDLNNMAFDEILDHFEPKEKSKTVVKKRESMGTNSN